MDSLLNNLANVENELEEVTLLNEIAYKYFVLDLSKAEFYAQRAAKLAQKNNFTNELSDSYMRLGVIAQLKGNHLDSEKFYKESLKIREDLGEKISVANVYCNLGLSKLKQDSFERASFYYQQGLKILNKEPLASIHGKLYNNLGELHYLEGNYKLALIYLDSSINIWGKFKNLNELANTTRRKGDFFLELGNKEKAEETFKNSLKVFEQNKNKRGIANASYSLGNLYFESGERGLALSFYKQADSLSSMLRPFDRAKILMNLGINYKEQNIPKKALFNYEESLKLFQEIGSDYYISLINHDLGNLYKNQEDYNKAKKYYLKSVDYLNKDSDSFILAQVFFNLSEVYSKLGQNDLAYQFSRKYNTLRDSIYFNKIDAINFQLNFQEEQKEKALLEAENLEIDKINQRKNLLIALLFVGGLFLTAMFYAYYNRQKTKEAYLEIDDLLRDQELAIAYARLDEKDLTQKQIGQDLHDSLGAILMTIKLYFKDINQNQKKTLELLDEAAAEVRRISHSMQSGMLKKFGLTEAVKELAGKINDSNQLKVKVYAHGLKQRIPNDLEFKLYKIIQELVGNALKHAKASQLTISLTKQEELLNIIVEDNGIGFQSNQITDKDGIGLKNITYRVTELSGTCHFDSVKGRGTNVIIDIPLKNDLKIK